MVDHAYEITQVGRSSDTVATSIIVLWSSEFVAPFAGRFPWAGGFEVPQCAP